MDWNCAYLNKMIAKWPEAMIFQVWFFQTLKNVKGRGNIISNGNLVLYKWMKNIENGKYVSEDERLFLLYLVSLKAKWLLKTKRIAMHCDLYNT